MALPEIEIIARCDHWRVFGTGTWSGRVPGEAEQRKLIFGFLYQVAELAEVPFGRLLWSVRREHGELSYRMHYHWLIGSKDWFPTLSDCFRLNHIWLKQCLCGWSRNRIYALRGDSAVEYVTKCLSSEARGCNPGGDWYETQKFGLRSSEVTLSNSLVGLVAGRRIGALRGLIV